jgi:hypothetical protein
MFNNTSAAAAPVRANCCYSIEFIGLLLENFQFIGLGIFCGSLFLYAKQVGHTKKLFISICFKLQVQQ